MGEREEASEQVVGGSVFVENKGGGGVSEEVRGERGVAKHFFGGQNSHQLLFRARKTTKHKHVGEILTIVRDWVGLQNLFMCFLPPIVLWGRGKNTSKIFRKSWDNPGTESFMCLLFGGFICSPTLLLRLFSPPHFLSLSRLCLSASLLLFGGLLSSIRDCAYVLFVTVWDTPT